MTSIIHALSPDKLYLIALSGGADSVALALMMKEQGLKVRALHCNFHLRGGESDRDERFVRDFCQKHDIPLEVCHFDTLASAHLHKTSIEMEARDLRYQWFAQRVQALDAEAVCVAHHKDDQAETLLLNLIRGTGLKGLAAMHPERIVNGLRIIRPLLDITKEEILQYLARMRQGYVTDSTNLERDALRNRIRLDLMPMLRQLNPNITDCLARTAHNVRMELDTDSEESRYHRWLAPYGFSRSQILDIYAHSSNGKQTAHRSPLTAHHSPLTAHRSPFTAHRSSGLTWHSATHTLLLDRGEWILQENKASDNTASQLHIDELPTGTVLTTQDFLNQTQAFIDADSIKGALVLRPMRQGDRFRPYGMKKGTKLLSDFLTDRKVSLLDKQAQLVAVDSATDDIIWVVGREIDHRYRITPTTNRILRLICS
ncbi:MAG: tRNA lysidine(34) synthetase TilS [Bacteroidaceae bacterium]|nr:tRNA lysidine(34) synthetase TilS [Bacteroidaceae bacterium]